jgi:hypothetical protein
VFYTLAADLLLVGSLANLIAIERAAEACVVVSFRHARAGIPITLPEWRWRWAGCAWPAGMAADRRLAQASAR